MTITQRWRRLAALFDRSAWLLIAPAALGLLWVDPPVARTLAQWSLFGLVLSGVAVLISRLVFPHLDLGLYLTRAAGTAEEPGDVAAAIVAASVIVFVAVIAFALIYWAKP